MAETDLHIDLLIMLRVMLQAWFARDPRVYVSGNVLIYYVPGDKRRHVSPDVFVVFGVAKKQRDYYLTWEEGKTPAVAIEITSKSTQREDTRKKFVLYRDVLKVKEYFLFDPRGEYLDESLQGYRLHRGQYVPIAPVDDRLPSKQLGLHLEADGRVLRLYNPASGQWLPTPGEHVLELEAEIERLRRELARRNA